MVALPRGAPFIDLMVPAGAPVVADDIQTRIDLLDGGAWRVVADDGTMEQSSVPLQPVRGGSDRYWVVRQQPLRPGESLQLPVSLCIDVATQCGAQLAATGVSGLYAWAVVLFDDIHFFHGLLLLDWLYNPRLRADGEVLESDDAQDAQDEFELKIAAFSRLWTKQRSGALAARLPPGAVQQVEQHQAVTLLGPGGSFDPRFWQNLAMQLVLPEVRSLAAASSEGAQAPGGSAAPPPGPSAGRASAPGNPVVSGLAGSGPAAVSASPDLPPDGMTPLARAELEARERARQRAEAGADATEPEEVDDTFDGPPVEWRQGPHGSVLWLPMSRYDDGLLRELRDGQSDGLARRERPGPEALEAWLSAGAPFLTEVKFLSRLFLDNTPLHNGALEGAAREDAGCAVLDCHLPRVAPVRVVVVPAAGDAGRRILVGSNRNASAEEMVALAVP